MSFFRNDEVESGSNMNAILSFICSIITIGLVIACFFFGSTCFYFAALTFVFGVIQSIKGKLSEKRTIAIIAQIIFVISAIATACWCVITVGGTISSLFGG